MIILAFVGGFILGGVFSFFLLSWLTAGSDADDRMRRDGIETE